MLKVMTGWTAASLLLLGPALARAESKGDARAVVDRAIKALGGKENLSKYKAFHFKGKGVFSGMGQPFPFTGEWWLEAPERWKAQYSMDFSGTPTTRVEVVTRDKGWASMNDQSEEMTADQLKETHERLYGDSVVGLVALTTGDCQLSMAGESQVNGKPAVGIKVTSKGHRDFTLYFDKETGLPVKSATRAKNMTGDEEVKQETFYSDYKDFSGIKRPTKVVVKQEGKDFVEWQVAELKPLEKLDDSLFAKPEK